MKIFSKKTKSDIAFDIVNYALLILIGIITIYPLIFVCSASVSDPVKVLNGEVWLLPKGITTEGFKRILSNSDIWTGYRNSIFYTVFGTLISLVLTLLAAFPLSRKEFKARNIIMAMYTFTMFFNGGLIPTYLLVKGLGLLDTIWAILLPSAVSVSNLIITRTFFQNNIPDSLKEAAEIDGCSDFKFFIKIVLPVSKAIIAVMALYYGVAQWNAYFSGMIYLSSRELFPLQLFLREILIESASTDIMTAGSDGRDAIEQLYFSELIKYGVIIVSSLPVLIAYPFVQKYFIKGVMIGSIKG